MRVLVTGATGYVGSRLVPALLAAGHDVVVAARRPAALENFEWYEQVTTVEMDVLDADSTRAALEIAAFGHGRVDVAYYLIHAIGEGDFVERDREGSEHFGEAAAATGVGRIVYLGGFVPDGETLSTHLESRAETAEVLERQGVPVVWLRAAVIIGGGSTSFEIIRHLAERLPVIPVPEWMNRLVAPIAVDDVVYYLVAAATASVPPGAYDIAGDENLPYRDLLQRFVRVDGLRRLFVPVRGVPPDLAGAVAARLTPVPTALTSDLIDSLRNTMVGDTRPIRRLVPDPPDGLTSIDEALRRALNPAGAGVDPLSAGAQDPAWVGGDAMVVEIERPVHAPAATTWERIEGIGGRFGFEGWPLLWRVRGVGRRLAAGSAFTHERASRTHLTVGDVLDHFVVTRVAPDRSVTLVGTDAVAAAELTLGVTAGDADRCTLHITYREPVRGTPGRVTGWIRRPSERLAFDGMARTFARDAEAATARAE